MIPKKFYLKPTNSLYSLIIVSFCSGWITYLTHEFFHWLAYISYGIETTFKLNTIELVDPNQQPADSTLLVIYSSGVGFIILQAFVCYTLLKGTKNIWLFTLLLAAFLFRFLAAILNFSTPTDEGKISLLLGLPLHTFSAIVVGINSWFFYKYLSIKTISGKEIIISVAVVFASIYLFSLITI